jgi:hypothetical protein
MYGKQCSIALLLAGLLVSTLARAQGGKANEDRSIQAINRSVDASSQSVNPEVKPDSNAAGNAAKVHAAKSASSWGLAPKSSLSVGKPSAQSAPDRTSPDHLPSLAGSATEKSKLANREQPGVSTMRNSASSAALEKHSSTSSARNTFTVGKIGMGGPDGSATTGTHSAAAVSGAASGAQGGSPSFGHGLGRSSTGASSSSIFSGGSRLSGRQTADTKERRQKRAGAHGLLKSDPQSGPASAPGAKGPANKNMNTPPYGASPDSDHGLFHPGQN